MTELLNTVRYIELKGLIKSVNRHEKLREKHERSSEEDMIAAGLILIEAYTNAKGQHGVWKKFCEEMELPVQTAHRWKVKAGYKPTEKARPTKTPKFPAGNSTRTRKTTQSNSTKTRTPVELPTVELPVSIRSSSIIAIGQGILGKAQDIKKKLLELQGELDQLDINAIVSTCLSGAETLRENADIARRFSNNKRDHLTIVKTEDVA